MPHAVHARHNEVECFVAELQARHRRLDALQRFSTTFNGHRVVRSFLCTIEKGVLHLPLLLPPFLLTFRFDLHALCGKETFNIGMMCNDVGDQG